MADLSDSNKKVHSKTTQLIRLSLLMLFLVFLTWIGYRHQVLGGGPSGSPTVDALCPFGGLESIYSWLKDAAWLRRIAPSSLILFTGVLLATLSVGRVFCGWICPLGALNEFISLIAIKLNIKKRELPDNVDRPLRFLKYIILIVILYTTWQSGTLTFRAFDPWAAWMHLSAGLNEAGYGSIVLLAALFAGIFIERFWCRYMCPLGAALGGISRFSLIKVRRSETTCINCGQCHVSCPVGLHPDKDITQKNGECIVCGKCVAACPPVADAMKIGTSGRNISFLTAGVIGVAIIFAVIFAARQAGYWQTFAAPSLTAGADPVNNIFGWMNVKQAAETAGIDSGIFLKAAGLPEDTPIDVPLKKLPGVDDEKIKDDIRKYLEENKDAKQETPLNPQEIKGSATFNEICSDFSVQPEYLFEKLGLDENTDLNAPIKDIMKPLGREVQEIRDILILFLRDKQ
jgi:NapH/MauN family ferredoxin-type protein